MTRIVDYDNKIDDPPCATTSSYVRRKVRAALYAGITTTIFWPFNTILFYNGFSGEGKGAVREVIPIITGNQRKSL